VTIRSSIDLGTNTCLLLIADINGKAVSTIEDHATVVRLGEGVDKNRQFLPAAMERTKACLQSYAQVLKAHGLDPKNTVCIATSQARDSSNSRFFFDQVQESLGFKFQVISGEDEAKYTFLGGLLPDCNPSNSIVIDIGGGSTELITFQNGKSLGSSLDIGSVRYTERFLKSDPVSDAEFWECQAALDVQIQKWTDCFTIPSPMDWVGVAGTVTTLAQAHLMLSQFDRTKIDGLLLSRGDIHRLVEELKWRTQGERCQLPGVTAGRADVLLAGAMILWRTMELFQVRSLRVSTRGLRYGVLSEASF